MREDRRGVECELWKFGKLHSSIQISNFKSNSISLNFLFACKWIQRTMIFSWLALLAVGGSFANLTFTQHDALMDIYAGICELNVDSASTEVWLNGFFFFFFAACPTSMCRTFPLSSNCPSSDNTVECQGNSVVSLCAQCWPGFPCTDGIFFQCVACRSSPSWQIFIHKDWPAYIAHQFDDLHYDDHHAADANWATECVGVSVSFTVSSVVACCSFFFTFVDLFSTLVSLRLQSRSCSR